MNERIKELYNQCFVELENDTPNIGFDFEKFAELIVAECINIVNSAEGGGNQWDSAVQKISQDLKKHFK